MGTMAVRGQLLTELGIRRPLIAGPFAANTPHLQWTSELDASSVPVAARTRALVASAARTLNSSQAHRSDSLSELDVWLGCSAAVKE